MSSSGTVTTARPFVRRRDDIVALIVGAFLIAICAAIAHDGRVSALEARVFHWVNGLPEGLYPFMNRLQLLGVLGIGPVVAVVALVLRKWRLALAAALVTVGKLAAERLIWKVVERSRPGTTIVDAIVRGNTPTTGLSFVSGHVILITGLAWVVLPYLRGWWRVVPWVAVALVILARMYLGAHAPLDVTGGFAAGLVVGGAVNLIVGVPKPPPDPDDDYF